MIKSDFLQKINNLDLIIHKIHHFYTLFFNKDLYILVPLFTVYYQDAFSMQIGLILQTNF